MIPSFGGYGGYGEIAVGGNRFCGGDGVGDTWWRPPPLPRYSFHDSVVRRPSPPPRRNSPIMLRNVKRPSRDEVDSSPASSPGSSFLSSQESQGTSPPSSCGMQEDEIAQRSQGELVITDRIHFKEILKNWMDGSCKADLKVKDEVFEEISNSDELVTEYIGDIPIGYEPGGGRRLGQIILREKELVLAEKLHEHMKFGFSELAHRMMDQVVPGFSTAVNSHGHGHSFKITDNSRQFVPREAPSPGRPRGDSKRDRVPDVAIEIDGNAVIVIEVASTQTTDDVKNKCRDWFRVSTVLMAMAIRVMEDGSRRYGADRTGDDDMLSEAEFMQMLSGAGEIQLEGENRRFVGSVTGWTQIYSRRPDQRVEITRELGIDDAGDVQDLNNAMGAQMMFIRELYALPGEFDLHVNVDLLRAMVVSGRRSMAYDRYKRWYTGGRAVPAPEFVELPQFVEAP